MPEDGARNSVNEAARERAWLRIALHGSEKRAAHHFGVRWLDTAFFLSLGLCVTEKDRKEEAKEKNKESGVEPPHSKEALARRLQCCL
jgi:hypothetical protein